MPIVRKEPFSGQGEFLSTANIKGVFVMETLDEMCGSTSGVITLPVQINWTPRNTHDLSKPNDLRAMYECVLTEARSSEEFNRFLNKKILISLWSQMRLPKYIKEAWEAYNPELRQ